MKTKLTALILSALLIASALVLASCSESEPLPEGVSEQPDLTVSEMAAELDDGTGNLRWPAELLPEGFPVPEYTSIYSVEREDNELHIIMLGAYSLQKIAELYEGVDVTAMTREQILAFIEANYDTLTPSDYKFSEQFAENQDFVQINIPGEDPDNYLWVYRGGWKIQLFAASENNNLWLSKALEASGDARYAWEIVFSYSDTPESYFWKYPGKYESIGFPDKGIVSEYPAEYMPDSMADIAEKLDVVEYQVQFNGVRTAITRAEENYAAVEKYLASKGFVLINGVYLDKDGNSIYYYEDWADTVRKDCLILLVRKYNDKIQKGGDGE